MTPVPVSRGWSESGLLHTQTSVAYKFFDPFKLYKKLSFLVMTPIPTVKGEVIWTASYTDVITETGDPARLPAQVAGRRRLIRETGKFCAEENKVLF
jgi:hypothetical protein